MKDEGVAVSAIEKLRSQPIPPNVTIMDGGTRGITLLHVLDDFDRIVIIDAADFNSESGSVKKFDLDAIKLAADSSQLSMHGVSLAGILSLAASLGKKFPRLELIAIQPKEVGYGIGLSQECHKAIPKVLELVADLLSSNNF